MSARSSDRAVIRIARPDDGQTSRKCPVCGKAQDAGFKPFCSKRCADIDLSRWLNGVYSVPTDEGPEDPAGEGG